ncbi:MAG: FAD-binding protein [Acidiferrobacterales bacterium]|nr:FAD-binding protein [Acidiferrobacterales bacterium]
MKKIQTDVLILGSGGAGLLAAIHAHDANPSLKVTVATKGLAGKSGCTRMVQGGYNVALGAGDSIERHFQDTIEGGKWINDQELAWALVSLAPERVLELENRHGCFFDRNRDGTLHQKAFAGQTFDRTVHKGDLTGIEIMNRLAEQVRRRPVSILEEHRAIELIPDQGRSQIAAVLLIDIRSGKFVLIQARAVIIATGAGPTMYKFHTPSADKSCDGLALALRSGLVLRDMEMVQFHPTGLLAGAQTRITGTIIEEGLRGAGGHLLDGANYRFMQDYDERGERATRDVVSRAMFERMRSDATGPNGGVFICMSHLDENMVRTQFKGMVKRCRDIGLDLVSQPVEVTPTAHYVMGGIEIDVDCSASMAGVFAAGEDSGGVHGANRLGGNGVGNSTVFGGIAGDSVATWLNSQIEFAQPDADILETAVTRSLLPFEKPVQGLNQVRESLYDVMWEHAGIMRSHQSLEIASTELNDIEQALEQCGVDSSTRSFNLGWHDYLNLKNQILVSHAIVAAAKQRTDSRGAHYRSDCPHMGRLRDSEFTRLVMQDNKIGTYCEKVRFTRLQPPDDGA